MQPGAESGNVIVVLQQESHEMFSRKGHNLYLTHKLGVTEALCGMQFVVRQLDGRSLLLRNPPGNVIEPGMPPCDDSCLILSLLLQLNLLRFIAIVQ